MKLDKNTWLKVIAANMLMLCFSLNVSLLGQMFSPIKAFYNISLSQGGLLLSMQSIGGLLLSVVCILFITSINKTKLLVGCGLVLCVSLIIIGVLPPLFLLFIIFIMLGFSGGAINTLTNSVMVDTVPQRTERYINFMHTLFSFGSVIAPMVSQIIFPSVGLTGVFLIFGGFALCWAVYAVHAFSDFMKTTLVTSRFSFTNQFHEALRVLKTPGMGAAFLISIFITAWQLSAIYYISSYFTGLSGDSMMGALALSLFFLGMMVSRLAYSRVADKYSKGIVLLLTNVVCLLAWIAVFIVPDITVRYIFVILAALACGNNFPVTFSAACQLVPGNTAAASGYVNLGYYFAILTFIPVVGVLGDAVGLDKALLFSAVPLLFIIPAAQVLHKRLKAVI